MGPWTATRGCPATVEPFKRDVVLWLMQEGLFRQLACRFGSWRSGGNAGSPAAIEQRHPSTANRSLRMSETQLSNLYKSTSTDRGRFSNRGARRKNKIVGKPFGFNFTGIVPKLPDVRNTLSTCRPFRRSCSHSAEAQPHAPTTGRRRCRSAGARASMPCSRIRSPATTMASPSMTGAGPVTSAAVRG